MILSRLSIWGRHTVCQRTPEIPDQMDAQTEETIRHHSFSLRRTHLSPVVRHLDLALRLRKITDRQKRTMKIAKRAIQVIKINTNFML